MREGRTVDLFYDDKSYVFARVLGKEAVIFEFNKTPGAKSVKINLDGLGMDRVSKLNVIFGLSDGNTEIAVKDNKFETMSLPVVVYKVLAK